MLHVQPYDNLLVISPQVWISLAQSLTELGGRGGRNAAGARGSRPADTHGRGFLFHSMALLSSASWPLCRASPPFSPVTGCTLKQSIFSSHVPSRTKWTFPDGSVTSPVTYKDGQQGFRV